MCDVERLNAPADGDVEAVLVGEVFVPAPEVQHPTLWRHHGFPPSCPAQGDFLACSSNVKAAVRLRLRAHRTKR